MSGVQSICHPFATVIFKIITEQRKGSEHAEQSADSLPIFLFMVLQAFMSGVQSICHPFATVIFKIITEQRKGSEHAEQSADSLPIFLFMTFLLV